MIIPRAKASTLSGRTVNDPQPKPAKELALPTHGLTGIKHETLTAGIVHAAFNRLQRFVARKKGRCTLIGNHFELPHDTIPSIVSGHCKTKKRQL